MSAAGIRVRVYFGERDRIDGKPLWAALIDYLRREGASGATVTRATAGFGAHSKLHAANLVDISSDLPLVLEWIGSEDEVARLLPGIEERLDGGLIISDPVTIHRYQPHNDRSR